jgi:hypothetical protein
VDNWIDIADVDISGNVDNDGQSCSPSGAPPITLRLSPLAAHALCLPPLQLCKVTVYLSKCTATHHAMRDSRRVCRQQLRECGLQQVPPQPLSHLFCGSSSSARVHLTHFSAQSPRITASPNPCSMLPRPASSQRRCAATRRARLAGSCLFALKPAVCLVSMPFYA